ncbi:MAG: redoxin family protein [Pyrinomonadaceae bacterium]
MRKILTAFLAVAGLMAFVMMPLVALANAPEIGSTVESFSLPDTDGKTQTLESLKGKNGTVVVWLSAECPVVAGYKNRINEIAAAYKDKGIAFIGINSNATEDLNWVKSNMAEYGYKFPVLIDKGNVLADKWEASVTPEVYFLDNKNVLKYHGAVDNDRSGKNVQEYFLKTAFDSSLSGKAIEKTKTAAFGCSIKRAGKPAE